MAKDFSIMLILTLFILTSGIASFLFILKKKNMLNWMPQYISQYKKRNQELSEPIHILFSIVDHYEPQWGNPNDIEVERARVDRWLSDYPKMASKHKDSDGFYPQHTFFYPEEEYRYEHLNKIADICQQGFGEIEVHLHHHDDTEDNLRHLLTTFCQTLHNDHGALSKDPQTGELTYAFIHGNWALDNCDPTGDNCGINNELIILKETGCYADFTFPSAPHATQPSTINSIYYAKDDPLAPNSHNTGVTSKVKQKPWGDLLLITGPLMLNWKKLKKGVFPQIENSDLRSGMEPTNDRVDLWVKANIHVEGKPEWRFIKLHTHGTQEKDMDVLLGKPIDDMFTYLEDSYNDGENYVLHYVNSREMYNIVKAAEHGKTGNPNQFRDYILPRPQFKVSY